MHLHVESQHEFLVLLEISSIELDSPSLYLVLAQPALSCCVTASVDRKSAARQVEARKNASCRGFSITRYEGSRCLRRTRSGYGESMGMRVEATARRQVGGARESGAEGGVSRVGPQWCGSRTAGVPASFRIGAARTHIGSGVHGHVKAQECGDSQEESRNAFAERRQKSCAAVSL